MRPGNVSHIDEVVDEQVAGALDDTLQPSPGQDASSMTLPAVQSMIHGMSL